MIVYALPTYWCVVCQSVMAFDSHGPVLGRVRVYCCHSGCAECGIRYELNVSKIEVTETNHG